MRIFLTGLLGFAAAVFADPAVLVEAENDTVVKFIYTGGSAGSATHPAVSIQGKAYGLSVTTPSSTGARALVGRVGSSGLPSTVSDRVGLTGAGYHGVAGKGFYNGVVGEGGSGLRGIGVPGHVSEDMQYSAGVIGYGANGMEAYATSSSGYGLYAYSPGGYAGFFNGDLYATEVYTGSDLALKKNIRTIGYGLKEVLELAPKAYQLKGGILQEDHGPETRLGLIAQDVENVIPEIVRTARAANERDSQGKPVYGSGSRPEFKALNYIELIPVLVKAMQEQQALIEALQAEVAALRK